MYDVQKLEGAKVNDIYVDASHESIALYTDKGTFYLDAYGDCCSHSWYEHISGVDALKGQVIRSVQEIGLGEVMPRAETEYQEYVQAYSIKFTTDKGYFEIEMRNSSNGYYGGYVNLEEGDRATTMTELTEDF